MYMNYEHLLIFGGVSVATWSLVIYFWPRMLLYVYKRAIPVKGFGDGPIPVNTLYTEPQKLFAEPLASQTASSSNLMTVGVNRDTLPTVGWLDLSGGPHVMPVPDMSNRYSNEPSTHPEGLDRESHPAAGRAASGTPAGHYSRPHLQAQPRARP